MRLELIRAALTGSDPVRAALAGLIIMASNELDNPDVWVHSRSAWDDAIANAEQALADESAVPTPPADGEVAELVAWLQEKADDYECRMRTDFRALCAELADAYLRTLEHINNSTWLGYEPSDDPLLQRARAALAEPVAEPPEGEVAKLVAWLHGQDGGLGRRAIYARIAELLERHAAPVPKLALAPANDYKSRWLEEDGVMKPVINWIHTIPIEDKDIFHCAQSSCWCSPKVDKDNPEIILHQALTSAQDGWVLIGEIEAASEKPDSLASPPPSELIAELIPELRKVAEHLRDCNFRGFSNYVARAAELLGRNVAPVPVPVSERLPGPEDMTDDGEVWIEDPGREYPLADAGDYDWDPHKWILRPIGKFDAQNGLRWLPAHALPLPEMDE